MIVLVAVCAIPRARTALSIHSRAWMNQLTEQKMKEHATLEQR